MQPYTRSQNIALLVLRLITAVIFLYAAYAKLPLWYFEADGMSPTLVMIMKLLTIVEPLGALAIALGFLTRLAASGLFIIMVGAIWVSQFVMQIGFATSTGAGWNFSLVVLAGCIVLMAFGAGQWSVDAKRRKNGSAKEQR